MKRYGALLLIAVALATGLAVLGPARPAAANGTTPVAVVSVGAAHACAVSIGRAYCWGNGAFGTLGNGSSSDQNAATAVTASGPLNGKVLTTGSAGSAGTCVIDTAGAAYCWGGNVGGRLGDGTSTDRSTPVAVSMPVGVAFKAIAILANHSCAISSAGAAYCWGGNFGGNFGDGTTTDSNVPVAATMTGVPGGGFSQITVGSYYTCALTTTGAVYCWGDNTHGYLGDGTTTQRVTPTAVSTSGVLAGKTIVKITSDWYHTCAIDSDGKAYCWGENGAGQLGDGSTTDRISPVAVNASGILAGKHLVDIDAGFDHTCAVDSDGLAYCWGQGSSGELGTGGTASSNVPAAVDDSAVPAGTVFATASAGASTSCAQTANGRTYCWGEGSAGQIGRGVTGSTTAPAAWVVSLPLVPGTPTGVAVVRSGTTATVSWIPPGDPGSSVITGYTATASPGGASCTTAGSSCQLTGLSSSTSYTVRVAAANAAGSSASTAAVTTGGSGGGGLADTGIRTGSYVVIGALALWLGVRLRRLYAR